MQELYNINLDKIYHLRNSVDVYIFNKSILHFYFINTRKEVRIQVSHDIISFISQLDGKKTVRECLSQFSLTDVDEKNISDFLLFLEKENIIACEYEDILLPDQIDRYTRQITYIEDSILGSKGQALQQQLISKKVLIFGVGSVGSAIAIFLARIGIKNFVLIDKDTLEYGDRVRHLFYEEKYVHSSKCNSVKKYLQQIDSDIQVTPHQTLIQPDTDIENFFDGVDFVINTMSTPYILYTSLKIEKECLKRKIPLYVAGGFDGHLGSTGELIFPPLTPCVSCYMNYFSSALKDWKPKYNVEAIDTRNMKNANYETGGLAGLSMLSASLASVTIVNFMVGNYQSIFRGEYDFENIKIDYIQMKKNKDCKICNKYINSEVQ